MPCPCPISVPTSSPNLHAEQTKAYDALVGQGLKLDLTRGKPSAAQLDLSNELLTLPGPGQFRAADGTDCRNYGGLTGCSELREIFAPLLNVPVEQLVAGDNASLSIMHDTLVYSLLKGTADSAPPGVTEPIKFSLPVPGYDRHFSLCEQFGHRDDPVPLGRTAQTSTRSGSWWPTDPAIKGIWIVPTYANPNGAVYTDEVHPRPGRDADRRRRTSGCSGTTRTRYHHLTDGETPAWTSSGLAEAAGNPNRVFLFASTSKITFAGRASRSSPARRPTWPGTCSTWPSAPSGRTRSTTSGTRGT
jgi:DNA-binding transcriptional MocR family regulator